MDQELQVRVGSLAVPLTSTIIGALQKARNITSLYTHQVNAIDALQKGKNVIVSTSTASGKSIIYQVRLKPLILMKCVTHAN